MNDDSSDEHNTNKVNEINLNFVWSNRLSNVIVDIVWWIDLIEKFTYQAAIIRISKKIKLFILKWAASCSMTMVSNCESINLRNFVQPNAPAIRRILLLLAFWLKHKYEINSFRHARLMCAIRIEVLSFLLKRAVSFVLQRHPLIRRLCL